MKILVLSCDKNEDLFEPFHICMEKYWPNHPEIIYATETITNPYYKTINKNYKLQLWTKRIRATLSEIDDGQILIMIDDCFIRGPVDEERIQYASQNLKGNIAMFNFEKAFDLSDEPCDFIGFKKRRHGAPYEVSLMCGLWQKDKLIRVLEGESDPWTVEYRQKNCNFDYYINSGDYIIDWGYVTWQPSGVAKGKWQKEIIPFFEKEGIVVDYSKRGFND